MENRSEAMYLFQMVDQLFKIFSSEKNIKSPFLNRLGAQALRTAAARAVYNVSGRPKDPFLRSKYDELQRDGILIWPNFLPDSDFKKLENEVLSFVTSKSPHLRTRMDGPNAFITGRLHDVGADKLPETKKLLDHPHLRGVLNTALKTNVTELHCQYEHLIQGAKTGVTDPEADLHSDFFANTFKAWLYIKDVVPEDGPFVYVKGSHNVTLARLKWIYQESLGKNSGSRRISAEELKQSGLVETVVAGPRNTLIIANTHGFHRRSVGVPMRDRLTISFFARANPFPTRLIPFRSLKRP